MEVKYPSQSHKFYVAHTVGRGGSSKSIFFFYQKLGVKLWKLSILPKVTNFMWRTLSAEADPQNQFFFFLSEVRGKIMEVKLSRAGNEPSRAEL